MSVPRPRVGHIQFLNCLPLHRGMVNSGAKARILGWGGKIKKDAPPV